MKRHLRTALWRTPAAIRVRVVLGDATPEIPRALDSIGADVLVAGVPRRGVVSRRLFGTTAARLLRATRVPMLAVPDVTTERAHQDSASLQLAA